MISWESQVHQFSAFSCASMAKDLEDACQLACTQGPWSGPWLGAELYPPSPSAPTRALEDHPSETSAPFEPPRIMRTVLGTPVQCYPHAQQMLSHSKRSWFLLTYQGTWSHTSRSHALSCSCICIVVLWNDASYLAARWALDFQHYTQCKPVQLSDSAIAMKLWAEPANPCASLQKAPPACARV